MAKSSKDYELAIEGLQQSIDRALEPRYSTEAQCSAEQAKKELGQ
jgi:hypothetical protein